MEDGAGTGTVPGRLRAWLALGAVGVVAMLAGLAWDGVLHARSPELAHHEGVLTLSNPAHLTLFLGLAATVVAMAGAGWTALGGPRARAAFLTGAVVVVTASAATLSWAAGEDARNERVAAATTGESGHVHAEAAAAGDATPAAGAAHTHTTGSCAPTPAQQAAADKLVADTGTATARYADLTAATADGYRPATPPRAALVHYVKPAYLADGHELDVSRPESLVYVNTAHGPVLAGAMYMANPDDKNPPEVGGCLTAWHTHTDLCFSAASQQVVGFTGADGTCPASQIHYVPPQMMHVWLVDVPGGPFAHDVDGAALARTLGR